MYKKILLIKFRNIGDVLLTTPVFEVLKENLPHSFIAIAVNKGTEAVLENNPHLDQIITYDRDIKKLPTLKKYVEEIKFLEKIRKLGFSTTIDLTGGDRAAIISYFSGAGKRVGVKAKGFLGKRYLYNEVFEIGGRQHVVMQHIEVLKRMGLKIEKPKLVLNVTEDEKKWAKQLIFSSPCHKLVHIHPTSRWLFKCWKDEYIAEVIKWFIGNNYRIVLTASADERELKKVESILSYLPPSLIYEPYISSEGLSFFQHNTFQDPQRNEESPPIINLAGKLTLRQLITVSSICDIFFGIDTAPMHIAAALGKPVIALFGPSGAFNWGPWDNEALGEPYPEKRGIQKFGKNIVIQRDWNCIPCGQDGCKGSKISRCLFDIRPEEVIEILSKESK